jgi:type IV pilus assembly protein PilQ
MLYFVSLDRSHSGKLFYLTCAVIACLLVVSSSAMGAGEENTADKNIISMVSAHLAGNDLALSLHGSTEPTYTVFELFKPARIVVDVANATPPPADKISLPADLKVALSTQTITEVNQNITRFEFTFDHSLPFTAQQKGKDIVILVKNFTAKQTLSGATGAQLATNSQQNQSTIKPLSVESQLPKVNPLGASAEAAPNNAVASMKENFSFSGYNKEHITVDFYKIDLHNVFRLLRDVSGVNMVVDEAVQGSLTLALNDVPWDFALDIILNLKELSKEERFNTIVIYPKDKVFAWPQRAEDNLSFEADEEMVVQESLIIQQQERLPPGVIEAKKLIALAKTYEKKGNIETAIQQYEKALKKWPRNSQLANKIASIYLVHLRQNAKAAFFANKALKADKKNSNAALNAAIANANMHEDSLAQGFFDQSISASKPSSEALLSYAAFSEKQANYEAAAKLLEKHDKLYGQNLSSLVARARILDKMDKKDAATAMYETILFAGFRVPPDLKKYIQIRITNAVK